MTPPVSESPTDDEIHALRVTVSYLQGALNRQTDRYNSVNRARRRSWHRAEAAEAYARHLALQVDDAAALLDELLHLSPIDEVAFLENGQEYRAKIEQMHGRLWSGDDQP